MSRALPSNLRADYADVHPMHQARRRSAPKVPKPSNFLDGDPHGSLEEKCAWLRARARQVNRRKPQATCICGNQIFRLAIATPRIRPGEPIPLECVKCGRLRAEPR
jgi:hypothetical protein